MFTTIYTSRQNKILRWLPSDSEYSYLPQQAEGENYSTDDFSYAFNSSGFRCDEFPNKASNQIAPILFMGCSFTEGVGLPLHHCWPHFILEKIRERVSKVPFYNLAIGGTGVDLSARVLAERVIQIKPKVVCYLLSSIYRREFAFGKSLVCNWVPNFVHEELRDIEHITSRLFSDPNYALWQTLQSLKSINLAAKIHESTVYIFVLNEEEYREVIEYQAILSNIRICSVDLQPLRLENTLVPPHLESAPKMARDNRHPGARWQYTLANQVWDTISHEFETVELSNPGSLLQNPRIAHK